MEDASCHPPPRSWEMKVCRCRLIASGEWYYGVAAKRFVILVVLALLFWATTPGGVSVAGMPVACLGNAEAGTSCWITIGGFGVIVLGMGAGLVEIGIFGAGVLFATGQLSLGLIAFGQLALGPIFYCGQVGVGLVGMGQGGLGVLKIGQGHTGGEGRRFLDQLSDELNELLAFF